MTDAATTCPHCGAIKGGLTLPWETDEDPEREGIIHFVTYADARIIVQEINPSVWGWVIWADDNPKLPFDMRSNFPTKEAAQLDAEAYVKETF